MSTSLAVSRKPKYYHEPLQPHLKHEQQPLGKTVGQFTVIPSNKFYYDNYAYKVAVEGNVIFQNIQEYQNLVTWLRSVTYDYREKGTLGAINFYLREKSVVEEMSAKFGHLIVSITGPVDQEHLDMLLEGHKQYEYRKTYWYSKYDIRIETTSYYGRGLHADVPGFNKKLYSFVKSNFENYKWYVPEYQTKTYFNYLYINEEEWNAVHPFFKLSFPGAIRSITKCMLIDK